MQRQTINTPALRLRRNLCPRAHTIPNLVAMNVCRENHRDSCTFKIPLRRRREHQNDARTGQNGGMNYIRHFPVARARARASASSYGGKIHRFLNPNGVEKALFENLVFRNALPFLKMQSSARRRRRNTQRQRACFSLNDRY